MTLVVQWTGYLDDSHKRLVASTYQIQYRELEKEVDEGKTTTVSGDTSIAVIDGLNEPQNYEVKLCVWKY